MQRLFVAVMLIGFKNEVEVPEEDGYFRLSEAQLDEFRDAWAKVSRSETTIDEFSLKRLIRELPPPLGIKAVAPSKTSSVAFLPPGGGMGSNRRLLSPSPGAAAAAATTPGAASLRNSTNLSEVSAAPDEPSLSLEESLARDMFRARQFLDALVLVPDADERYNFHAVLQALLARAANQQMDYVAVRVGGDASSSSASQYEYTYKELRAALRLQAAWRKRRAMLRTGLLVHLARKKLDEEQRRQEAEAHALHPLAEEDNEEEEDHTAEHSRSSSFRGVRQ
jgi:hypothetical protein